MKLLQVLKLVKSGKSFSLQCEPYWIMGYDKKQGSYFWIGRSGAIFPVVVNEQLLTAKWKENIREIS